jgi:hypothetical protein
MNYRSLDYDPLNTHGEDLEMCEIVAIFSPRNPIADAALERATHSLRHRGPDEHGHWLSLDRRVALGHARLSIIDLRTGDQPIASEDEQTRIVVTRIAKPRNMASFTSGGRSV